MFVIHMRKFTAILKVKELYSFDVFLKAPFANQSTFWAFFIT